jgi:hypothetical protein
LCQLSAGGGITNADFIYTGQAGHVLWLGLPVELPCGWRQLHVQDMATFTFPAPP